MFSVLLLFASGQVYSGTGSTTMKTGTDSCDIILMRDGNEVAGRVLEITPREVKYKRCEMLGGPDFVILKSDVFLIKYRGGGKDVFEKEPANPSPSKEELEAAHLDSLRQQKQCRDFIEQRMMRQEMFRYQPMIGK